MLDYITRFATHNISIEIKFTTTFNFCDLCFYGVVSSCHAKVAQLVAREVLLFFAGVRSVAGGGRGRRSSGLVMLWHMGVDTSPLVYFLFAIWLVFLRVDYILLSDYFVVVVLLVFRHPNRVVFQNSEFTLFVKCKQPVKIKIKIEFMKCR